MACGFAAVHSQYMAATTVICRGFQAYAPGALLPPVFLVGNYQIGASGKAAPVVMPACGELPAGLQFDEQGIEVKLPAPTVAVTVQVGSSQRQPIAIVGLNRAGQRIDQRVIPGGGTLYTVTLVGTALVSLHLVGGGDGGRLVQICGASSSMQTILEDYFDPLAQPTGLLPCIEVARRLFAGYYLRPQEIILQGRLGSNDGIATLCGHRMPPASLHPRLGYDGFYTHVGITSGLYSEMDCKAEIHVPSGNPRSEPHGEQSTSRQLVHPQLVHGHLVCGQSAGDCLSPNWRVIRTIALALPLTVAAPPLLARVARGAGVAVAEIPQHEWVLKKAVAALITIGFPIKIAAAAIPYLTAGAELAAAWLICADVLG